jgi:hypothetical protein
MSRTPSPGDAVKFTLTFSGIVTRVKGQYVGVQTKRSLHTVPLADIVEVLAPTPPEDRVVGEVWCRACLAIVGSPCTHKQKTGKVLKHPHKERVDRWVQITGWTP